VFRYAIAKARTASLCAPGRLRAAEWSEFDLNRAEWRIAAQRMKMGEEHIVPLSQQALDS